MLETVEQSKSWTSPFHPYPYNPDKCRELTKQFIEYMNKTQTGNFMNDTILSFHKVFHIDKWIVAEEEILKKTGTVFDDVKLPEGYGKIFNKRKRRMDNPIASAKELKLIFYHPENKYNPVAILCTELEFAFEAFESMRDRASARALDEGGNPDIWEDALWCLWDDISPILSN